MTCKPVDLPRVAPGWSCCVCHAKRGNGTYNGEARTVCKVCGHERCDLPPRSDSAFLGMPDAELVGNADSQERHHRRGEILAVLRPADAKLAVKTARKIAKKNQRGTIDNVEANKRFQAMLGQQEYRFVGILDRKKVGKGVKPRILDPRTGQPIDHLKMGDSFIPYMELVRSVGDVLPDSENT